MQADETFVIWRQGILRNNFVKAPFCLFHTGNTYHALSITALTFIHSFLCSRLKRLHRHLSLDFTCVYSDLSFLKQHFLDVFEQQSAKKVVTTLNLSQISFLKSGQKRSKSFKNICVAKRFVCDLAWFVCRVPIDWCSSPVIFGGRVSAV